VAARESFGDGAPSVRPVKDGGTALGSGFIIDPDGLIITNRHVILGASSARVRFADGNELPAEIVGVDAPTDIALLRVKQQHLPALHWGSSTQVLVGDPVVVIGNPFGVGQSATAGILSARGRSLVGDPYIDFLQTDAAINHGNSGGPVLSTDGAVIGIASKIHSPNGGSIGLGFAIPAEAAASVVRELQAHGHVARGYLGISAQHLTPQLARALGVKASGGALVTAVEPQGPAAQALVIGDVLTRIGSTAIAIAHMSTLTAALRPGSMVELTVVRDRKVRKIFLRVGELADPVVEPAAVAQPDTWIPALGLGVASVSGEIRLAIRADDEPGGFIVTQLRPYGAGALAGLDVGDLITHLGTRPVTDVAQLAALNQPSMSAPLLLRVVRDGSPQFIAVTGAAR
jgi:serine protease Do